MIIPSLALIQQAQNIVYRYMQPTPQYSWPLINERLSAEVWIKHENHTPVGAFKIRGALVYIEWLKQTQPAIPGIVAATRGNHGQGVAMAARLHGIKCLIVVPFGNSVEKNRAMKSHGAELLEHGRDFQEALEYAQVLAEERGFCMVSSFHERLVMGTATYALEFFQSASALDTVYVPIGLGSSICGMCAARNGLGLTTQIVGVVASASPSYSLSFSQRKIVSAPASTAVADGLACRTPNPAAMDIIWQHVAQVIEVSDAEIESGMRTFYQDTHNVAEGAGAAALAGAIRDREINRGKRIGVVLTGGNVDADMFARVLAGEIAQ